MSGEVDMTYILDLTEAFDRLRAQLHEELLVELRTDRHAEMWPEWMSLPTAARYLDITPGRLRKLVARRAIPFAQQDVGCRVFFSRHDLDQHLHSLTNQPAASFAEDHPTKERH